LLLLALCCCAGTPLDDVLLQECPLIGWMGSGTAAKPAEEGKAPEAAVSDAASAAATTTEAPPATSAPTTAAPVAVRVYHYPLLLSADQLLVCTSLALLVFVAVAC
jgi:hypothetical protein